MATQMTSPTSRGSWEPLKLPANGHGFVRATGDAFESCDPATGEVVATLRSSSAEDLEAVAGRAQRAFRRTRRASGGAPRAHVIRGYARALRDHSAALAQ